MESNTFSPISSIREFEEQIASDKRKIGFFVGAGSSMSAGIPGIETLSSKVIAGLDDVKKKIVTDLRTLIGKNATIEDVLTRIRTIRELIEEDNSRTYDGISGPANCKDIDQAICDGIRTLVKSDAVSTAQHRVFAQWLKYAQVNKLNPIELFTTNYDLLFERAFEEFKIPYFDGFIGSVDPFFLPEAISGSPRIDISAYPPSSWVRLWKLHGSINWYARKDSSKVLHFVRTNGENSVNDAELMIFPSRDKYYQSRRLPFLTFQDRLREFLHQGEALLIVVGYSWSDQHLNEIILQGLKSNKRLAVVCLSFGDQKIDENGKDVGDKRVLSDMACELASSHPNLSIFGPDKACIGTQVREWEKDVKRKGSDFSSFWDESQQQLKLGDFKAFPLFLLNAIGFSGRRAAREEIEVQLAD